MQPFAQSYERTLYIDADVFLTEETPDLFDVVPAGHVSMHDDWSQLPSFEWVFEERRNILESQDIPMDYSKVVLNSGIVMSGTDTSRNAPVFSRLGRRCF